jgi:hypothetical protein
MLLYRSEGRKQNTPHRFHPITAAGRIGNTRWPSTWLVAANQGKINKSLHPGGMKGEERKSAILVVELVWQPTQVLSRGLFRIESLLKARRNIKEFDIT